MPFSSLHSLRKKNRLLTGYTSTSALLLSFVFLLIILLVNGLHQWREEQQRFVHDIELNLDNYAQQAKLLAAASFRTNIIFTRGYKPLIESALQGNSASQQKLWLELQQAIFNLTGYMVLSAKGELLLQDGTLLNEFEPAEVWLSILSQNDQQKTFTLRYGNRGGFYFYNSFYSTDGTLYYFVTRRSYSELSHIIYAGKFPGYELLLLDTRSNTVVMRENYYANSSNQPALDVDEIQRLLHRTHIPLTHWDIAALPIKHPRYQVLLQHIGQPVLVLLVFIFIAVLFRWRTRYHRQQTNELNAHRREAEQRANQALNAINDAFISTNTLGIITYINPKAEQLLHTLGSPPFIGQTLSTLWPDINALWNRGLSAAELADNTQKNRRITLTTELDTVLLEQTGTPLFEQKKFIGTVWLLRDISLTARAEQAIEESNQRYKALFDEASVGHCLFDISQFKQSDNITLLRVNDAAVRMTHAHDKEQLTTQFLYLTGKADNSFKHHLKRALTLNLNTAEFELIITTFSGAQRVLWATISMRSGLPGQALASFIDITEQKFNNEKIREREVFWNKVMDAMPDVVYVADLEENLYNNIIYRNRTLASMLGYAHSSTSTSNWLEYLEAGEENHLPLVMNDISRLTMGAVREVSGRFRHADGSTRIIKFCDTPFSINEQGVVSRYIGTARDVTEEVEQQELILESEKRYRLLAENITDIIWATDINLNFNFVSSSVTQILGYKPDEMLREGVWDIFKKRDMRLFTQQIKRIVDSVLERKNKHEGKVSVIRDVTAIHKHGHEVLLEINASPLWNDAGQLQGVIGICRDVGQARQLEQNLQLAAEVFDKSNEGILITDKHQNIVKYNSAFYNMTGLSAKDILGKKPAFLLAREIHELDFINNIDVMLATQGYWQGEISYRTRQGEIRVGWAGVSAVRDKFQSVQSLIVILSDITEHKLAEEKIRKLAYYDTLTGLANRSQLSERVSQMLAKAEANDQSVALLFIDLDRFKPINDSMGHPAGDAVLQEVARRLQACVKKNDFICRMGGDEFTLALDTQDTTFATSNAQGVAERILEAINQPYLLNEHEVFLSASIGIAIYPNDADNMTELLKHADMAMYHAKDLGRDNVQFFDTSMNLRAVESLALENDLRHALERNQFELFYQPQYRADTGQAVAAEALLRWHHPERGLLTPNIFIPIIEDTGLIVPIGQWVLEQACLQLQLWQQQGIPLQRIAVNVSARQFKQPNFLATVLEILEKTGIKPQQLELELTESILIDDVEHTISTLKALRASGVRTAIDDFGTGYSSLNYLKQFPVDTLKIDRSFIQGLPDNSDDAQIAHTIIAMAHNLSLGVIAEGVETQAQLDFLVAALCEEVQGFFFSRPLPASECFHNETKRSN